MVDAIGIEARADRPAAMTPHKQKMGARVFRSFLLKHPGLNAQLFQKQWQSFIVVPDCTPEQLAALGREVDAIRPITVVVFVVGEAPDGSSAVALDFSQVDDHWLVGEALPTPDTNRLLALAMPGMPIGGIDFRHGEDAWIFKTTQELGDDEKATVRAAFARLGYEGDVEFDVIEPPPPDVVKLQRVQHNPLDLTPALYLRGGSLSLKRIVERDEDRWRDFVAQRSRFDPSILLDYPKPPEKFGCLFDLAGTSDVQLSELYTLFDRVDLSPAWHEPLWLENLGLSIKQLQELVELGKFRLVLPYSAETYMRPELLEAIDEVDPSALVLSRDLAIRTIEQGQRKQPLLYAPLTTLQRARLLGSLTKAAKDEAFARSLTLYGDIFERQHYQLAARGALASLGSGVGSYLGEVFYNLHQKDARLELGTTGAAVEWALGLESTFIPRNFGGFDETHNANIIASFLNRMPAKKTEPFANRMKVVVGELLAVTNVPTMEVARNFKSPQIARFRGVANKLISGATGPEELAAAVEGLKRDVRAYEKRTAFIRKWHLDHIPNAIAKYTVEQVLEDLPGASYAAKWLLDMVKDRLPESGNDAIAEFMPMLYGLCTGSSMDAIIVGRSKLALRDQEKD